MKCRSIVSVGVQCWVLSVMLFVTVSSGLAEASGGDLLEPAEQIELIGTIVKALEESYIFPEVSQAIAKRMESAPERYTSPLPLDSFAQRLTAEFQAISHDGHLVVRRAPPKVDETGPEVDPAAIAEKRRAEQRLDNFGFSKVELLSGNVGYLDLRFFADAEGEAAAATAIATMAFLANSDALIIDLRQNHGGNPNMTQLMASYFFDEPVHLTDIYSREEGKNHSLWTHKEVAGKRLSRQPIYVLTSGRTYSAAEGFTYHLKHIGRIKVVGERTGGGAHPVKPVDFPEHDLRLFLPFARAINPITGDNWEGKGVQPDIPVKAEDALGTAHLAALRELLTRTSSDTERFRVEWSLTAIEAHQQPIELTPAEKASFVGTFGPCSVRLENGELIFRRGNWAHHRMVPSGQGRFLLDGFEPLRLEFLADPRRVRLQYIDQRQETYPATE